MKTSYREQKQHTINWVLEHPEEARAMGPQIKEFLDGEHLRGRIGIQESFGVPYKYELKNNDAEIREWVTPVANEGLARNILAGLKSWVLKIKGARGKSTQLRFRDPPRRVRLPLGGVN